MLMPLLGYFIIFNSYFVHYMQEHHNLCPTSKCDVTWKFYFLYFGATSIGLASVVYAMFCPEILKKYAGPSEFFDAEKQYYCYPSHLSDLVSYVEKQSGTLIADVFNLKGLIAKNAVIGLNEAHVISGMMGSKFELANESVSFARFIVFMLYTIGGVMIGIPALITFWRIFRLSFEALTVYWST
ncbi:hypothetical protein [Methylorubrum extorquens]|uniref:Transmembrane protein n=2 Tax=Methylorubrum extorquens TaxID=408 RepID=A0AAX3WFI5_METEX|nr:hypothetical protein [Methylorubrum extorquens]KQP85694.1 hypothetical protein ASF55_15215 [Methylobacterium sp. Leaf119]WHQ70215.1 hypothetical protein KEC54_00660 [Methylorubrum extorquens]